MHSHSFQATMIGLLLLVLLSSRSITLAATAPDASKQILESTLKARQASKPKKGGPLKLNPSKLKSMEIQDRTPPPLSVESLLLPRRIPLKRILRYACYYLLFQSAKQCFQTAGQPHLQTIWNLLYSTTEGSHKSSMPKDYLPSDGDILLSSLIASATNEHMPPLFLPSVGPLINLLLSTLFYIGTVLLIPRWSTSFQVFLDYKRVSPKAVKDDAAIWATRLRKNVPSNRRTKASKPKSASVLVRIRDSALQQQISRSSHLGGQALVVCPWQDAESNQDTVNALEGDDFLHPHSNYFELNQCRYYFDETDGQCIEGGPNLHTANLQYLWNLIQSGGLSSKQRALAMEKYHPYNAPTLTIPTVQEAFVSRISSPLVVVQFLGRIMAILEEGVQSLSNGLVTLVQHYRNAQQAIVSAKALAKEVQVDVQDINDMKVLVLHKDTELDPSETPSTTSKYQWKTKSAGDVIPGDIICMTSRSQSSNTTNGSSKSLTLPVDVLLLDGQCLTNEAVLTGESVPQSKIPLDLKETISGTDEALDMDEHRSSILFAGTTLVHATSDGNQTRLQGIPIPTHNESSAFVGLVLRTGTYSSKGQMLRALRGNAGVGAISNAQSEKDALRLIASLSIFAIVSCISLFIPRSLQEARVEVPIFRRIIQCTRIIIASIPSDLALALSVVAQSCAQRLRETSDVICSSPGSLLTAATIDTIVFDKTGTLTADTQSVSKTVSSLGDIDLTPSLTEETQLAYLAGCHSLVPVPTLTEKGAEEAQFIGDPLDQVSFEHSGWLFNTTSKTFHHPDPKSMATPTPIRLWQLKSFPFDANKRLSSALLLYQYDDGSMRLQSVTKGSPEVVQQLYVRRNETDFANALKAGNDELSSRGYRAIAMGSIDWTNTELANELFPDGLTVERIENATRLASSLTRNLFEREDSQDYAGFVCFDAAIRPSTDRIVQELNYGGLHTMMLTGDSTDAAVAVASQCGIMTSQTLAILEKGDKELEWRFVRVKNDESGVQIQRDDSMKPEKFSKKSLKKILKGTMAGEYDIATTGSVIESCLNAKGQAEQFFCDGLYQISVIARATPHLKKDIVSSLKERCGRHVLMCGDGVNDVTAMKSAHVSVALLNGFGDENDFTSLSDIDDDRRKAKVLSEPLGSNKKKKQNRKQIEKNERLKRQIEEAQSIIRQRVAERTGDSPDSASLKYELRDLKDMVSASMTILKTEAERGRKLKKGGGDAARILAEERRDLGSNETLSRAVSSESETIKPGEASLVAPFSCLHPSIDGVDAVLRAGLATAAGALATQEMIALQCLMSCYHLATLYRDGFRYGKKMWPVEFFMYMAMENSRQHSAGTSRPRLPAHVSIRPNQSLFSPSSLIGTISQALIHILTMKFGVDYARSLEKRQSGQRAPKVQVSHGAHPQKFSKFLASVASTESIKEETSSGDGDDVGEVARPNIFRRPPFEPNYETNMVFMLSILQSAISSLILHQNGTPFYRTLLESRNMCFISVLTIFALVILTVESLPFLNQVLELKPLPTAQSKLTVLGILVGNVLACIGCRFLVDQISATPIENPRAKSSGEPATATFTEAGSDETTGRIPEADERQESAADLEERLLEEESMQNARTLVLAVAAVTYFSLDTLTKKM